MWFKKRDKNEKLIFGTIKTRTTCEQYCFDCGKEARRVGKSTADNPYQPTRGFEVLESLSRAWIDGWWAEPMSESERLKIAYGAGCLAYAQGRPHTDNYWNEKSIFADTNMAKEWDRGYRRFWVDLVDDRDPCPYAEVDARRKWIEGAEAGMSGKLVCPYADNVLRHAWEHGHKQGVLKTFIDIDRTSSQLCPYISGGCVRLWHSGFIAGVDGSQNLLVLMSALSDESDESKAWMIGWYTGNSLRIRNKKIFTPQQVMEEVRLSGNLSNLERIAATDRRVAELDARVTNIDRQANVNGLAVFAPHEMTHYQLFREAFPEIDPIERMRELKAKNRPLFDEMDKRIREGFTPFGCFNGFD